MRYRSVDDYSQEAVTSPVLFTLRVVGIATIIGLAMVASCAVLGVFSTATSVVTDTATVAREEFGPRALLQKYEWFKDASASLDKKQADIKVYSTRMTSLEDAYRGQPRSAWPRDDREQLSIWQSEVAGVKASYNQLASEYNSEMAKFNWRFANRGMLPQGATEPLPREYKPYEEN